MSSWYGGECIPRKFLWIVRIIIHGIIEYWNEWFIVWGWFIYKKAWRMCCAGIQLCHFQLSIVSTRKDKWKWQYLLYPQINPEITFEWHNVFNPPLFTHISICSPICDSFLLLREKTKAKRGRRWETMEMTNYLFHSLFPHKKRGNKHKESK